MNQFAKPTVTSRRGTSRRMGAAMVEFAIVSPLLFLFFLGAFEFCRVAMIRHTADNAVYEAARVGIIPGADALDVEQEAVRILNSIGLNHYDVNVTPTSINKDTEEITVSVEVPLDSNSFVPNQFVGGRTIERQLTMRREGIRRGSTAR